jgi:hypothetical protein
VTFTNSIYAGVIYPQADTTACDVEVIVTDAGDPALSLG